MSSQTQIGTRIANIAKAFRKEKVGLLYQVWIYIFLVGIVTTFAIPLLSILSKSAMSPADYVDPLVNWIPTSIHLENYTSAWQALSMLQAARYSLMLTVVGTFGQVISCAIAGYGFARFRFPGRNILFILCMLVLGVAPHLISIPLIVSYRTIGLIGTFWPMYLPAFFTQGIRGPLFLLVFVQMFRNLPFELEDAARVDGAGEIRTFWNIMLPMAKPAVMVTAIMSMVWYWNDAYYSDLFRISMRARPLALRFEQLLRQIYGVEGMFMAAAIYMMVPPLVFYAIVQKFFVQSIDRTGLVG